MRRFYRRLRDEARALPGVTSAAISTTLPLSGSDIGVGFTIDGRPADPGIAHLGRILRHQPRILLDDGHPAAAGPGVHGTRQRRQAPDVVIINETIAAKYWPNEDRARQADDDRLQQRPARAKSSASSAT